LRRAEGGPAWWGWRGVYACDDGVMREWITPDILGLLRADPWFGSVPPDFEQDLLALATLRRLQAGAHLFFRGDAPDGLYAMLEGSLRVAGVTEAGKDAILSLVDAPSWFGEIALFAPLPRTHNAGA